MTPNGKVRFYIGIPSGNGSGDWTVTLRAEDATSGEVLFEMDVDPDDYVQLQRGLVLSQEAFIGRHLDRVGKRMEVESVRIPKDVFDGLGYGDEQNEAAKRWADRHCAGPHAPWADEGGPEEWSTTRHNYGWGVHMRRWVAVE